MRNIITILSVIFGAVFVIIAVIFIMSFFQKKPAFTMSQTTVIKQIQKLNRLETASYTIEKVIEAGKQQNAFSELLFGDRILLIAHGQVIAGFDLSKVTAQDISVDGTTLTVRLPTPEILVTTLDNKETRVYDRKQGVLSKGDKDLESKTRLAATEAIRLAACQGHILDEASKNARSQLTALFQIAGFTTVILDIPQGSC